MDLVKNAEKIAEFGLSMSFILIEFSCALFTKSIVQFKFINRCLKLVSPW